MTATRTPSARGQGRRRALLDATLRVAARGGAAAVSHRAVAAEAGVPLGSTTYYFASKEEMLADALRHAAGEEVQRLQDRLATLDTRSMPRRRWIDETVAWAQEQLEPERRPAMLARYVLQLEAVHNPELREVYRDWMLAVLRLAEELLRAAGSSDPRHDAPVLVAAVDGLLLNQLALLGDADPTGVVRTVVRRTMMRLSDA